MIYKDASPYNETTNNINKGTIQHNQHNKNTNKTTSPYQTPIDEIQSYYYPYYGYFPNSSSWPNEYPLTQQNNLKRKYDQIESNT
jgi:hypothetical protein